MKNPTFPTTINTELTAANTTYSIALPPDCTYFLLQCRQNADVTFAFDPLAPRVTLKAGASYASPPLRGGQSLTVYVESTASLVVVETIVWR